MMGLGGRTTEQRRFDHEYIAIRKRLDLATWIRAAPYSAWHGVKFLAGARLLA
jgi:hypothetical protein